MAKKTLDESNLLVRNPDVVLREEDRDGALLYDPDTNQVRVINASGLFIWKQCDGKKKLPAIIAALKSTFEDVPEKEVEDHVKAFVNAMSANGFLQVPAAKKKKK